MLINIKNIFGVMHVTKAETPGPDVKLPAGWRRENVAIKDALEEKNEDTMPGDHPDQRYPRYALPRKLTRRFKKNYNN